MGPLKQWICDACGEIIEDPEDGYVVWRENDSDEIEMLIVHHSTIDENGRIQGSDRQQNRYPFSSALVEFVGEHGLVKLLSLLDPGPAFCGSYTTSPAKVRVLVEMCRRLHVPYYEEARVYWNQAESDGFFDGANEVWMYLPKNLKDLIDRYK